MSVPLDPDGAEILGTGTLRKSGEPYAIVALTAAHIPGILALTAQVRASLAPEEQSFLARKDRAFFECHFASGSGAIGIVQDGALIAQSIIVDPTPENPRAYLAEMILDAKPETCTILQGVIVDPAARGNDLIGVMIGAWLERARLLGRPHALTAVAPANVHSWAGFMRGGLHIHKTRLSPNTNVEVYVLHANADAPAAQFNTQAGRARYLPVSELALQKRLFGKGYAAVAHDGSKLAFHKKPSCPTR